MKPEKLYALLDAMGIEYEVVEIFEGVRLLSIEVNDEADDEEAEKTHKAWRTIGLAISKGYK